MGGRREGADKNFPDTRCGKLHSVCPHDDALSINPPDLVKAGLVSVSFRKLSVREVVDLAASSGLSSLEWGGDIHVPHGEIDTAREVARMTGDGGLEVAAYGSYYWLGESEAAGLPFAEVLDTAVALGAPTIRVWAGKKSSAEADAAHREAVGADALRVAAMAEAAGVIVGYEYHANTLTDTAESTRALLAATEHPAIRCLWQPAVGLSLEETLDTLEVVLPRLAHVHAYYWGETGAERFPLSEGRTRWRSYLARIRAAGPDPEVLLEFVPGDDPEVLPREAATLRELLTEEG